MYAVAIHMSYSEEDVYRKNLLYLQNELKVINRSVPADVISNVAIIFARNHSEPISFSSIDVPIKIIGKFRICGLHVVWLNFWHKRIGTSKTRIPKISLDLQTFLYLVSVDAIIWGVEKEWVWYVVAQSNFAQLLLDVLQTEQVSKIVSKIIF